MFSTLKWLGSGASRVAARPAARGTHPSWVMPFKSTKSSAAGLVSSATVRQPRQMAATSAAVAGAANPQGHQATVDSWQANVQGLTWLKGPRPNNWWTGTKPSETPGLQANGALTALAVPDLSKVTRKQLKQYFQNTWALTEVIFSSLQSEEAFYRPPRHQLRHPKIFYYAHPAVLYVNKFRVAGLLTGPINEYFESIFEVGVDEMQWDDLTKNHMLWPSVEEVRQYRAQVYNTVVDIIDHHPAFETIHQLDKSPFWAVVMGTEHEKIHLETSSVLMRELPINLVRKPEFFPELHPSAARAIPSSQEPVAGRDFPINELLPVEAGTVHLGKPVDFPSFGWDNEYGSKQMHIKSFKATKYLISNGEFLDFVRSGGYLNESAWEPEGWKWRCFRNVKWPTFWHPVGPQGLHQYRLRTIFQEIDMPWNWPACVNYHEAKAYANWRSDREGLPREKGYRLTTEGEHKRMTDEAFLDNTSVGVARDPSMVADGPTMASKYGFNLNMAFGSESPVDALAPSSNGFHDLMGNVWRWNEDHMSALPNFRVHPFYNDFTLPCFDGQHTVILGGSFMSCGDEASPYARFHFRPHFFQHSGFRLVLPNQQDPSLLTSCMDNQGPYVGDNPFRSTKKDETERKYLALDSIRQYIHLHYDSRDDARVPAEARDYPQRLAQLVTEAAATVGGPTKKALDLGCSVGGVAFELSRTYDHVLALDISSAFIEVAQQLQEETQRPYNIIEEGDIKTQRVVHLPSNARPDKVEFKLGDALSLAPDMGSFDAVVAANLLDRLAAPAALLHRLGGPRGLVRPGGILVVASPFTWLEKYTPRDLWLGGLETPTGDRRSLEALKQTLSQNFVLLKEAELPFVLREHARKYEYVVTAATVWRHK